MKKIIIISALLFLLSLIHPTLSFQGIAAQEEISVREVTSFTYLCLPHKGPFTDFQEVLGNLMLNMRQQNIVPGGPMIGVYYSTPDLVKPEELEWEIGFPITPQTLVQAPLQKKQWIFTTVATAVHKGPYETSGETYQKIAEWLDQNNYESAGPILERYWTDPSQVRPEELKTEIWAPVRKK
jgi:AraC family transcriptional regulator